MKRLYPMMAILLVGLFIYSGEQKAEGSESMNQPPRDTDGAKSWEQDPLVLEVVLQRSYMDGVVTEERMEETIWAMEDFWAAYDGWEVINQSDNQIIFGKEMNELSPVIKKNGYFGVNDEGELTIFDGIPENQKAIQSFFYIDTDKLESRKSEELQKGIKINSKDQYLSLIKEYEQYSISNQ